MTIGMNLVTRQQIKVGDLVSIDRVVYRIISHLSPNGLFVQGENIETFEREMLTTAQIPSPRTFTAKRGKCRCRATKP